MIITKKDAALIYEILSTGWLYDKLFDSNAFGDRMDEIDEISRRMRLRSEQNDD
jgi:hypothetical protein